MGDRCNFIISTNSTAGKTVDESVAGNLVLYSHWGGWDAAPDLQAALLAAKPRWSDDTYCARIIVSRIVGNAWNDETGFGLSVGQIPDNEWPYMLVDIERQLVRCEDREMSFPEFLAMGAKEARVWAGRAEGEA